MGLTFPYYFHVFGHTIHPHLLMELIAYAVAFRLYLILSRRWPGPRLSPEAASWVIVGAVAGALVGSKTLAIWENIRYYGPHWQDPSVWFPAKTIVGGLLGGWVGVEIAKRKLGVRFSTGDAFVFPLILGMSIGRVGCFLTGLADGTCGTHSHVPWAVNFGDGLRHPTQLYDIVFLLALGSLLLIRMRKPWPAGKLFLWFVASYVAYRFCIEFLKDRDKVYFGVLSAIQVACLVAFAVAIRQLRRPSGNAEQGKIEPQPALARSTEEANVRLDRA